MIGISDRTVTINLELLAGDGIPVPSEGNRGKLNALLGVSEKAEFNIFTKELKDGYISIITIKRTK